MARINPRARCLVSISSPFEVASQIVSGVRKTGDQACGNRGRTTGVRVPDTATRCCACRTVSLAAWQDRDIADDSSFHAVSPCLICCHPGNLCGIAMVGLGILAGLIDYPRRINRGRLCAAASPLPPGMKPGAASNRARTRAAAATPHDGTVYRLHVAYGSRTIHMRYRRTFNSRM